MAGGTPEQGPAASCSLGDRPARAPAITPSRRIRRTNAPARTTGSREPAALPHRSPRIQAHGNVGWPGRGPRGAGWGELGQEQADGCDQRKHEARYPGDGARAPRGPS